MINEEIEKALYENYDKTITDWLDCYGVYWYIKRLKAERDAIRQETARAICERLNEYNGDLKDLVKEVAQEYGVEVD